MEDCVKLKKSFVITVIPRRAAVVGGGRVVGAQGAPRDVTTNDLT